MTKNDFKKKFPDVKVQRFETEQVLSKQQIMDIVNEAMTSLNMGLIYYESRGRDITCFTSDKMKAALDRMLQGETVINPVTGEEGVITSDKPYLICGEFCINVDFPGDSGSYSCEFFVD